MEYIIEKQRKIPVITTPEVLVAGGGPAGIGAAIAAARSGVKTMLIERYGFPGGNLTTAMVNPFFTFHDEKGNQVIRGIAEEFVDRMKQMGASLGHVADLTFDSFRCRKSKNNSYRDVGRGRCRNAFSYMDC